jgi:uncharacterized protein (TIGR04168 family)
MSDPVRIAVIGDIHYDFDEWDVSYFNASEDDLLLFVGDLSELRYPSQSLEMAGKLSQLNKPAIFIPGNHDVHNVYQIIAEILHNRVLARLAGLPHYRFHLGLQARLKPVLLGAYSAYPYYIKETHFDVIAARPYAMGGSSLSYSPLLKRLYGIQNIADSEALLCQQVDSARSDNLIFLAHNGPSGLGEGPADIWGCDFAPRFGDFGDRDLATAIQYAQSSGKRILAVIAGHMHLQTFLGPKPVWERQGTPGPIRPWHLVQNEVQYINAARVPRIFQKDGKTIHHFISLEFCGVEVEIKEELIEMPFQE